MLAEEKKSNALYAIKVLKKEFIIENDEMDRFVSALLHSTLLSFPSLLELTASSRSLLCFLTARSRRNESSSPPPNGSILSSSTFTRVSKPRRESTS